MTARLPTWIPAIAAMAALVLTGCSRGGTAQQAPRADSGVAIAAAVIALERSAQYQLTADQARQILPLLKVLRDTPVEDREGSRALAEQIRGLFTDEQRGALERLRTEAQERARQRRSGGPPGAAPPGGPPGFGPPGAGGPGFGPGGPTPDPARRAEFRRGALDRAIQILEPKVR